MKLERNALTALYAAAAALLLAGMLAHLAAGIGKMRESATISSAERQMYAELQRLPRSPLLSLEHGMAKVAVLQDLDIGERVVVSFHDVKPEDRDGSASGGDAGSRADGDTWYMDRIGKYRYANIRVRGDVYQQAYILSLLVDDFPRFLLIDSIESDAGNMSVEARVYGAEPPPPAADAIGSRTGGAARSHGAAVRAGMPHGASVATAT